MFETNVSAWTIILCSLFLFFVGSSISMVIYILFHVVKDMIREKEMNKTMKNYREWKKYDS